MNRTFWSSEPPCAAAPKVMCHFLFLICYFCPYFDQKLKILVDAVVLEEIILHLLLNTVAGTPATKYSSRKSFTNLHQPYMYVSPAGVVVKKNEHCYYCDLYN
jgi:hypothetical protein